MSTVSLCMIVKNEQATLGRCLESVADLVDEVIIVDTGSTDRTVEIARQYTHQVFTFPWVDDFAAARNFSFSKAECDFCMWLDADDVLTEENRAQFRQVKACVLPEADVVMCRYHTATDAAGNPVFSYYRERLVRNHTGFFWEGAVHEAVTPRGRIVYSELAITHRKEGAGDPDRNLRIFEKLLGEGKQLAPREQFYYARELYYHQRYEDAIQVLEHFLTQGWGWVENNIEACRVLADCYDALGRRREALRALLESFSFDTPRAELCCALGHRFLEAEEPARAAYWYRRALTCRRNDASGAFVSPDCYGYLPCIQLCVCYYRMGNRARAILYNERAGRCKPGDPAYLFNQSFFAQRDTEA